MVKLVHFQASNLELTNTSLQTISLLFQSFSTHTGIKTWRDGPHGGFKSSRAGQLYLESTEGVVCL